MRSEHETWAEERRRVQARLDREARRAQEKADRAQARAEDPRHWLVSLLGGIWLLVRPQPK